MLTERFWRCVCGQAEVQRELQLLAEADERDTERKQALSAKWEAACDAKRALDAALAAAAAALHKTQAEPERARKQADSVQRAAQALRLEVDRLEARAAEAQAELARMEAKRAEAEALRKSLAAKLELHRETIGHRQADVEAVSRSLDQERARHHELVTERVEIELKRKEADEAVRHESEAASALNKELHALKRKLRKKRGIAVSSAARAQTLMRRARRCRQDVDVGIARFLTQEGLEEGARGGLRALVDEADGLEADVLAWAAEEQRQDKLVALLSAQREFKASEAVRAAAAERDARASVKVKGLAVQDLAKRHHEATARLREFGALYDVVKGERNKYANLIQASNQALAEMCEKVKRERAALQQSQAQRDALRLESNKAASEYTGKQAEVEQQITEIERLNTIINGLERDMLRLKGRYEGAVEARNAAGVQLIDRNDELCVLYEKANLQEKTLEAGAAAVRAKEGELRMLRLQAEELARRLHAQRRSQPDVPRHDAAVARLQADLAEQRALSEQLGHDLEDPANAARWRDLGGADADQAQLAARIALLEARLSDKKEKLLERELVLEELAALTQRLRDAAGEGRGAAADLARRANAFQGRAAAAARAMMATVSELSMYQATAMRLQREKVSREAAVADGRARLDAGEAPSADAEREWRRRMRALLGAAAAADGDEADGEDAEAAPNAVRTTAPQRPNAYIPDEIGIPKPYGGLAPFRPQEPGSTMRHMRLPRPPQIEI
ncbi:hypothetical protein JKP88DRAFT_256940 [Tribonema minus]|uniref:Cilia- and flagella-associated protein 58 central coiled coil domain-containing protein n=1 Tax=Tribonema minus TaxID=303371 RepID=A0A836CM07_9STRA|nr:hypothetical protein JKP88DRAFT_256940 [Tribonema minus]